MIKVLGGKTPRIHPTVFVSEMAYIIGDVEIEENSSVWPGTVIRADAGFIRIGKNTCIQDNSTIHGDADVEIGDNVVIGHKVLCHARLVGNSSLLGSGCTVNDGVEIGDGSLIASGAVLMENVVIPQVLSVLNRGRNWTSSEFAAARGDTKGLTKTRMAKDLIIKSEIAPELLLKILPLIPDNL